MTVSTTDSVIEYVSGGPAFPIPYRFLQNSDILAVLVKQDGSSETLVLGSQYTLTGAGTQNGGTLTSAYAAGFLSTPGASLAISRVMTPVQPTDLRNQGRFLAETHETVFDRLTMLIQQGFSSIRRALLRPLGKNYYDAEGRLIRSVGDGSADLDAVNIRTMRSYVDAAIAGVVGGFGWFIQSGTGAIYRTFQGKMRDTVSVKDFGAVGDGTTDDTIAIRSAFSASPYVLFPPGIYIVTEKITVDLYDDDSLSIVGAGSGVTTIELNTGGDGLEFNLHGNWWLPGAGSKTGLRISDISFSTTNNRTGVGLAIYGESVQGRPAEGIYLERIRMRGKSDFNQFWFTALKFRDACPAWIDSPEIHAGNGNDVSTCIEISGTAQGTSPVHYNIISPILYFGLNAIKIGDFVEGVYITQHTIVGCQYGVYWHPSQGESGLSVIGGHIAAVKSAIDLDNVFDFIVEGCLIYRSGAFEPFYGVNINRAGRFTINGNVFRGVSLGSGETGVYVNSSIPDEKYGGVISGNNFTSFNGRGLWLGANANFVSGHGNRFGACSVRVLRQDTSGNCSIDGSKVERNIVVTLTGGAISEQFDVAVPAGIFRVKPAVAFANLYGSLSISASYDFDSPSSTQVNIRFVVRSTTGTSISPGNYRFAIYAAESSVATT